MPREPGVRGDRLRCWREHGLKFRLSRSNIDCEPLLLVSGPNLAVGAPAGFRVAMLPLGLCPRDAHRVSLDFPGALPT